MTQPKYFTFGINIDVSKTKVVIIAKETENSSSISNEGTFIEQVQKFFYLGQIITEDSL